MESVQMETEKLADVSDSPSVSFSVLSWLLAWKLAGSLAKLVWQLLLAIVTSIGAGLILLVGAYNVISFGSLGVAFVLALLWTVGTLVFLFFLSIIVSVRVLRATIRASTYRRIHFGKQSRLHWVLIPDPEKE
jgi:hypothetical protein